MNALTFTGPAGLLVDAVLQGTLFLALLFLASPLFQNDRAPTVRQAAASVLGELD